MRCFSQSANKPFPLYKYPERKSRENNETGNFPSGQFNDHIYFSKYWAKELSGDKNVKRKKNFGSRAVLRKEISEDNNQEKILQEFLFVFVHDEAL